jgi:hypothetical protein
MERVPCLNGVASLLENDVLDIGRNGYLFGNLRPASAIDVVQRDGVSSGENA